MLIKNIADTSGLVTTAVLNTNVENKIPDTSSLGTTTVLNKTISEVVNNFPHNSKRITTHAFNRLTAEHFAARLKQADLVKKPDFDHKVTSFNKCITSNKTKHSQV